VILSPTKYMNKVNEQVHRRVPEEVLAWALFQPQTALVPGRSKHQVRKEARRTFVFAVTPTNVHAFRLKDRGYTDTGRLQEEIAVWPRAGMRVETGRGTTALNLTDLSVPLSMKLVTLHLADGSSVTLGIVLTIMRERMEKMVADFVQALETAPGS